MRVRVPAWLYLIGWLLLACAVLTLVWSFDPFGRRKRAEQRATTAEQQAINNAEAVRQVEHVYRSETIIREQAQEATDAIQAAPGADDAVPADVLAAWRDGIGRLRGDDSEASDHRP